MMNKLIFTLATMIVAAAAVPAQASLVLGGNIAPFTSPGTYSLELTATSSGGDSIAGVAIGMDFTEVFGGSDTPTLWVPNPVFDIDSQPFLIAPNVFGVTGTSISDPDLVLGDGETGVLGTITFTATQAGVIRFTLDDTFIFRSGDFDDILVTFSSNSPALVAVPEPSAFAALATCGLAVGRLRRRRLRLLRSDRCWSKSMPGQTVKVVGPCDWSVDGSKSLSVRPR